MHMSAAGACVIAARGRIFAAYTYDRQSCHSSGLHKQRSQDRACKKTIRLRKSRLQMSMLRSPPGTFSMTIGTTLNKRLLSACPHCRSTPKACGSLLTISTSAFDLSQR